MKDTALAVYEAQDVAIVREPSLVLEEAQRAAKALTNVIAGKKKKVMFNNEQYLEFEDWQTVGRFYGITAKVKETRYVAFGEVRGFEATAVAIRGDGMEVSQADAMCLNDEANWGTRPKYEWRDVLDEKGNKIWEPNPYKPGKNRPKSEKVQVADEPVPLYQLRSMAQTRACAKVLRNVLAWVVVLAGYKPTPAEEMGAMAKEEYTSHEEPAPPSPGAATEPGKSPAPAPAIFDHIDPGVVNDTDDEQAFRDHLYSICAQIAETEPRDTGAPKRDVGAILYELTINKDGKYGRTKTSDIPYASKDRKFSPLKLTIKKAEARLEAISKATNPDDGMPY